jgi:hypothetical protein
LGEDGRRRDRGRGDRKEGRLRIIVHISVVSFFRDRGYSNPDRWKRTGVGGSVEGVRV